MNIAYVVQQAFSQSSPRKICYCICELRHQGLGSLSEGIDRLKCPPQEEDHSDNDPGYVLGFPSQRTRTFPARFGIATRLVSSEETCLVLALDLVLGSLSC